MPHRSIDLVEQLSQSGWRVKKDSRDHDQHGRYSSDGAGFLAMAIARRYRFPTGKPETVSGSIAGEQGLADKLAPNVGQLVKTARIEPRLHRLISFRHARFLTLG